MPAPALPDLRRILGAGALAGLAGGILLDAFIYITGFMPRGQSILALWQFVASAAFGKAAFASTGYAWAGLAMHLAVSIAWGIGYAYAAATRQNVAAQPVLSGFVFGLVVYVVMQLVLFSVQTLQITSAMQIVEGIVGHSVFFGLPVALIVARQLRAA